jgi:Spy/CpxP family protein refolding chaperone
MSHLITGRGLVHVALAGILVSLAAGSVWGGQSKKKWWHSARFQQELALSPDQVTRLEQVFQESLPALKAEKRELDRLEGQLSGLIADASAPESSVLELIDKVEASRSALGRTRSLMLFRLHRVLNPEQRAKLAAMHKQSEREQHGQLRGAPQ